MEFSRNSQEESFAEEVRTWLEEHLVGEFSDLRNRGGTGQEDIPVDYFADPLEIPLVLSGNFGELRSNHFHSGLDIKTQQRVGLPIYAPADGFVSRIKIAHGGYGKALYVKHPNGYSTVYAHLQRYGGPIEDFVKAAQYQKERYEIELFPEQYELCLLYTSPSPRDS